MKALVIRLLLVTTFLASSVPLFSQGVIKGKVRDADGPVAGAFVLGYSGQMQKAFCYSGEDGAFTLSPADGVVIDRISVSMMGYAMASVPLEGRADGLDIVLERRNMQITSSLVKSDIIEEKSDTLVYYTSAFKDGTERVAVELLAKLPGVTVTTSGGIRYNGTPIGKFYVEGMDLMGSRYGVVTNNLSAEDIARVEVYQNHQPISVLKDVVLTDRAAVNIILKEDVKGSWLFSGDASLGAPVFPLFSGRAMFSRFGKKSQGLFLLKGNNLGEEIVREIREQAYFGKTGAFLVSEGDIDSDLRSVLNPRRNALSIPQEYWYDNLSGIGSLNHLSKLSETSQVRLSMQFAGERYEEETSTEERIFFPDGTSLSLQDLDSYDEKRHYLSGDVSFEDNTTRRFISDDISFSGQIRTSSSAVTGTLPSSQHYDLPSMKVANAFNVTRRLGERFTLEITDKTHLITGNHTGRYTVGEDAVSYVQHYNSRVLGNDFMVNIPFKMKGHTPSFSVGLETDYTRIESERSSLGGTPGGQTSLKATKVMPYVSFSDLFYIGRIRTRVTLPASLSMILVSGRETILYPLFSPGINFSYRISQSLDVAAGASYSMSRSDVNSLLPGGVMTNYRTLSYADSLRRSNTFRTNLSLNYSDNPSLFYVSLSGSTIRQYSDKAVSGKYLDELTTISYVPQPSGSKSYSASLSVKKYFGVKTFVIEARSSYLDTSMDQYLQGAGVKYRTRSVEPYLSLALNPVDWFSLKTNASYSISKVTGMSDSDYRTFSVESSLRISPVKRLAFDLSGSYIHDDVKGMKVSSDPLVKAMVSWSLSKATLFLEGRNLLDVREYRRESVSTFRTLSSVTSLRPRSVIIGIRMSSL